MAQTPEDFDRQALSSLGHRRKLANEKLKGVHTALVDAVDKEEKCQHRVEKQQSLVDYHRTHAAAVSQQIRRLNSELKEQERAGWEGIKMRDDGRSAKSFERRGGVIQRVPQASRFGRSSSTGALPRKEATSPVKAAAMLTLQQAVEGQEVDADVVESRIVASGRQAAPLHGKEVYSASGTPQLATSFIDHGASITGQTSSSGRLHSRQSQDTDNSEGVSTPQRQQRNDAIAAMFSGDMDDVDLYKEVVPEDTTSIERTREDRRLQAQSDYQNRCAIAKCREEVMDIQAEKRRVVEERRRVCQKCEDIREAMIVKAGGAKEAFKILDCNGSGQISLSDFDGGMRRIGVKWKELTGAENIRSMFKLFDHDRKGYVTFGNLFPLDARDPIPERMSTPEFWRHWCNQNGDVTASASSGGPRNAKWEAGGPEEKLDQISNLRQQRQDADAKKKWMRGMIHRLKHRGKSDARCREICALHLPRGSGPRDLEDVQTFSQTEVEKCKKKYNDKVQNSVRNIEKTVFDMHDQRRSLHNTKLQLYQITEEPLVRQRAIDDAKGTLAGLGGAGGLHLGLSKYHEEEGA